MEQGNKGTEMTNNYCVNCKHCRCFIGNLVHICINDNIVDNKYNLVTGDIEYRYSANDCEFVRGSVCKGNHFEPKISVWSKFVSLFKHK